MAKTKNARSRQAAAQRRQGGGRVPPRTARPAARREIPWLPVVVGGVFLAVLIAMLAYLRFTAAPVAAISCDVAQTATHYHAHLTVMDGGQSLTIPANIGIQPTCFYWLHTHDTSGVIHIEAPADQKDRTFTLGDFFKIWNNQPLDSTHIGPLTVPSGKHVVAFLNGKQYNGSLSSIPLKPHGQIVIEVVPPQVSPPKYSFQNGL